MASLLFETYTEALLTGTALDLSSVTVKAVLIDSASYTYSSAHNFLDDVAAGARVGTAQTLASKTTTGGVFDAADIVFTAVAAGSAVESLLLYVDTGVESTSRLIALIDLPSPVTPTGGDIDINFDSGSSRIFKL